MHVGYYVGIRGGSKKRHSVGRLIVYTSVREWSLTPLTHSSIHRAATCALALGAEWDSQRRRDYGTRSMRVQPCRLPEAPPSPGLEILYTGRTLTKKLRQHVLDFGVTLCGQPGPSVGSN